MLFATEFLKVDRDLHCGTVPGEASSQVIFSFPFVTRFNNLKMESLLSSEMVNLEVNFREDKTEMILLFQLNNWNSNLPKIERRKFFFDRRTRNKLFSIHTPDFIQDNFIFINRFSLQ